MKGARCSSCNGRIVWALTTAGRRMPVDLDPVEGGNVLLVERGGELPPRAEVLGRADRPAEGVLTYRAHFSTCPDAGAHRRR